MLLQIMIRRLEHSDLFDGAEIEVKPKSRQFTPGKLFLVLSSGRVFSGVSYTTHYALQDKESQRIYSSWPLSLVRRVFHKVK